MRNTKGWQQNDNGDTVNIDQRDDATMHTAQAIIPLIAWKHHAKWTWIIHDANDWMIASTGAQSIKSNPDVEKKQPYATLSHFTHLHNP